MQQETAGTRILTLEQHGVCFLHSTQGHQSSNGPTLLDVDHIFPKTAARTHKIILCNLRESHENKTMVCKTPCHRRIDSRNGKIGAYQRHGMYGLAEWIAVYYPRPSDDQTLDTMYYQWRVLFSRLHNSLAVLKNRDIPKPLRDDYRTTKDAVEFHLDQWESGPGRFVGSRRFNDLQLRG